MSAWHCSQNCIVVNHMIKFEFTGVLHINEVTKCLLTMLELVYTGLMILVGELCNCARGGTDTKQCSSDKDA